jgi:hypothetical protein
MPDQKQLWLFPEILPPLSLSRQKGSTRRNDVRKGIAAELMTLGKILSRGYPAHHVGPDLPYDVVIEVGGRLCRVQVKSRQKPSSSGIWRFSAKRGFHGSAKGMFDYEADDYDVSVFFAGSIERAIFIAGVRKTFRATTADFLREGAEHSSLEAAILKFRGRLS